MRIRQTGRGGGFFFGEKKERDHEQLVPVVREEWLKSFQIRKELICAAFIIMPDHIHGLVGIELVGNLPEFDSVETHSRASLRNRIRIRGDSHSDQPQIPCRKPRSISSFVAGFKSVATKRINEIRETPGEPVWQPRFWDRVVRDENEFQAFYQYIVNNPIRWWAKEQQGLNTK